MSNNYLITGYWGEPHVTAENDRGINAGIFGTGKFVLPVGEVFRADYIGNNTIQMRNGKLIDNGAAAGIPTGEYIDFQIANAGQGMKRNDIIAFRYTKDNETMIERGEFVVIQGDEKEDVASDPSFSTGDLLDPTVTIDHMPLYRVSVSGASISEPERMFTVSSGLKDKAPAGYGMGETAIKTLADVSSLKDLTKTGIYSVHLSTGGYLQDEVWIKYALVIVDAYDSSCIVQTVKPTNSDRILQRQKTEDKWGAWEWVNPILNHSLEYQTTERFMGKPVFYKVVDCGKAPAATTKTITFGGSNQKVIEFGGFMGSQTLPFEDSSGNRCYVLNVTPNKVTIKATYDWSDTHEVSVWVKYIKTE